MFKLKHPLTEHMCKFKIDKMTYSKSQGRTFYYFNQHIIVPNLYSVTINEIVVPEFVIVKVSHNLSLM